ncbi:MAG: bifunctional diaminohydroxyphosphoribosylaminopyrimidine deaminase/5-amino-6-(5-phosphoribosylamino)uracil reductase RibD [Hyphomicrobiales bacterium]
MDAAAVAADHALSVDPDRDRRFMGAALAIGRRNLGLAWPNPAVGAIVVRETENGPVVVGRGWTAEGGRPHAEPLAIAEAGELARGATCYVTLEPCSHHGRTRPCADVLVEAGVGRVVAAIEDPDVRVAGRGFARLADAGIAVSTGVLAAEARRVHAGHIRRVVAGRPHVQLKLAVSADGMIGRRGEPGFAITGREVRGRVHLMRAEADAIMVGIGTVLADDPLLTCRLPGLGRRSPIRVVVDGAGRLPLSSALLESLNEAPLWVVVDDRAGAERRAALEAAGASLIDVPRDAGGRSDLVAALGAIAGRGITRLMVEGGATLARALLDGGLVDEAMIFSAATTIGAGGLAAFGDAGPEAIAASGRYACLAKGGIGADSYCHWWVKE